ncbi:MAG: response regulator transcription factor [Bifidobacteriaceae bacterium]|jgi:two-component system response regulator MtrA|nr:response regulator transcription factor [Bifidobacteriaceae bacterium]
MSKEDEKKVKIFIIDDDVSLADMLTLVLQGANMEVVVAYDAKTALSNYESVDPDLILLDYMLPGMMGIGVLKKIRQTSTVPVIILTAISDTDIVVESLESGANGYLTKPINSAELIARIHSTLNTVHAAKANVGNARAYTTDEPMKFKIGDLTVSPMQRSVTKGDKKVHLTNLEFQFLLILIENPDRYFSREELLEKIWNQRGDSDPRIISVLVGRLRDKIEDNPKHPRIVETVRGIGYALGVEVEYL